jgi:hypothetical protein
VAVEGFGKQLSLLKNSTRADFIWVDEPLLCYWLQQGGTTPMMGQQSRTESLFYYFRLEEQTLRITCCE